MSTFIYVIFRTAGAPSAGRGGHVAALEVESVYRPMGDEKLIDELAAPGRRPS
jgi:hypothetical protein